MNWYARYPGDYRADTADLSLVEHGAYALLLDHYYASDGDMPGELEKLNRICSAVSPAEADAVASVASRFFPVNGDGRRHNGRADREMAKAKAIGDKRRTAAERRWKASPDAIAYANADASAYANGYANEMQLHTHTTYHNPHTTTTTTTTDKPPTPLPPSAVPAAAPPVVVSEKPKRSKRQIVEPTIPAALDTPEFRAAWDEWKEHRRQAGKRLTALAMTRQLKQLTAMGPARAIAAIGYSIEKNWAGIFESSIPAVKHAEVNAAYRSTADAEAQRRAAERQAAADQCQREEQEWVDWMSRHDMAAVESAVWSAVDVAPDRVKAWMGMPADQRYANLGFRREARRYGGRCVATGDSSPMSELVGAMIGGQP